MELGKSFHIILTLISGISWTIVYILIIIKSFRDKTYGMPFLALAFNVAWELIFSFILVPPVLGLQGIINRIWFVFDIIILIAYFIYGEKEWPSQINKTLFYLYSFFGLGIGFLFVYLISVELDHSQGMYAAFVQNLMMSFLFIGMANNRKSRQGQSIGIAVFKLIGTLAPTLLFGVKSNFVLFLGAGCFVVDLIYLWLLSKVYNKPGLKNKQYSMIH